MQEENSLDDTTDVPSEDAAPGAKRNRGITKETRGRRSSLTPVVQQAIVDAIEAGAFAKQACLAAGIGLRTYYEWKSRGAAGEEPYAEFLEQIREAEAKSELRAIQIIANAALDQWQAAAWYLERKHYKRWARKEKMEHSAAGGGSVGGGVAVVPLSEIIAAKAAAKTNAASGGDDGGR